MERMIAARVRPLEVQVDPYSSTRAIVDCRPLAPGLAMPLGILLRRTLHSLPADVHGPFPVRRVDVVTTRLCHRLEALDLEVQTTGTIDPIEAISRATTLLEHQIELLLDADGPGSPATPHSINDVPPDMEDVRDIMLVVRLAERIESAFCLSHGVALARLVAVLAEIRLGLAACARR